MRVAPNHCPTCFQHVSLLSDFTVILLVWGHVSSDFITQMVGAKDFWTEAIWTSAWPDKCAISVIPAGSTTHSSHTLGTPTLCSSQFATKNLILLPETVQPLPLLWRIYSSREEPPETVQPLLLLWKINSSREESSKWILWELRQIIVLLVSNTLVSLVILQWFY